MEEGLFLFKSGDEDMKVEVVGAKLDGQVELSVVETDGGVEVRSGVGFDNGKKVEEDSFVGEDSVDHSNVVERVVPQHFCKEGETEVEVEVEGSEGHSITKGRDGSLLRDVGGGRG